MQGIPVSEIIKLLDEVKDEAQEVLTKVNTSAYLNLLACERIKVVCSIMEDVAHYVAIQNHACLPSRHLDDNN